MSAMKLCTNGHPRPLKAPFKGLRQAAFQQALAQKIYPKGCGSVLDLHDFSEGAARAAIDRWLPLRLRGVWCIHFWAFWGRLGGFGVGLMAQRRASPRNHWEGRSPAGLELVVGAGQLRKPWARGRTLRLAAMAQLQHRGVGFRELRRAVFGFCRFVLRRFRGLQHGS